MHYATRKTNGTTAASSTYTYDGGSRIAGISSRDGSSTAISSYAYTYNGLGQISSQTENGASKSFGYDSAGQLTGDGGTAYTYDGTGNRTLTGYSTDTGNQLVTDGVNTYAYDAEGNLTDKTSSTEHWVYEYDQRDRLTSAKQYEAAAEGPEPLLMSAEYKYDALNNRIQKTVDPDGDGELGATTEKYALEWWNPAKSRSPVGMENADVLMDLNADGSLKTRYLRGDVVDQVFARMDSSGNPYWLLTDRQGSVRDVLDGTGAVKDTLVYDAFGNVLSESDASFRGRYAYTGRELDVETGLQYNRARYYDSATARWITQDPLGFDAGDGNLYRYVFNRATTATDPSGLDERIEVLGETVYWTSRDRKNTIFLGGRWDNNGWGVNHVTFRKEFGGQTLSVETMSTFAAEFKDDVFWKITDADRREIIKARAELSKWTTPVWSRANLENVLVTQAKFLAWYYEEKQPENMKWLDALLKEKELIPPARLSWEWMDFEPGAYGSAWLRQKHWHIPKGWESDQGVAWFGSTYHPGAALGIRKKSANSDAGNQATYDADGNLIRSGLGAGTADKVSPEGLFSDRTKRHKTLDVEPFHWALLVDRYYGGEKYRKLYIEVRPPINPP